MNVLFRVLFCLKIWLDKLFSAAALNITFHTVALVTSSNGNCQHLNQNLCRKERVFPFKKHFLSCLPEKQRQSHPLAAAAAAAVNAHACVAYWLSSLALPFTGDNGHKRALLWENTLLKHGFDHFYGEQVLNVLLKHTVNRFINTPVWYSPQKLSLWMTCPAGVKRNNKNAAISGGYI